MRLTLFILIACLPSCVVLDVVEGFRQFGGESPSRYSEWRGNQTLKRQKL